MVNIDCFFDLATYDEPETTKIMFYGYLKIRLKQVRILTKQVRIYARVAEFIVLRIYKMYKS